MVKRPEEKESHWSRVRKGESREFGKGVQVYIQLCNIDVRKRQNPLALKSHSRPEPPVALSSI